MQSTPETYPATLAYDPPDRIANWRPLVPWFLAIPHYVVLYVLGIVAQVLAIVSWFIIVFTGKVPEGITNFQAMYLRYQARTFTYAGFLEEEYPPFGFDMVPPDPGDYPRIRVDVRPELEGRNRLTVGFRFILAIPQLIVLFVLMLALAIVLIIGFFAVLFTAHWPEGLRMFAINVYQYQLRVSAYVLLVVDEYPPFALT